MVFGEAMDSGDKATNKALSAAYKYAALQVFCVPVDADDADHSSHEVEYQRTSNLRAQLASLIREKNLEDRLQSYYKNLNVKSLHELTESQLKSLFDKVSHL